MDSKSVDRLLKICFKADEWSIVSSNEDFRILLRGVRNFEDLEQVIAFGGKLVDNHRLDWVANYGSNTVSAGH